MATVKPNKADKTVETSDAWLVAFLKLRGFQPETLRRNPQLKDNVIFAFPDTKDIRQVMESFTGGEVMVRLPLLRKEVKGVMDEIHKGGRG